MRAARSSRREIWLGRRPLFETRVFELAVDIAPSELEALKSNEDRHAYVYCTVREGDRAFTDVGIHCRGNPEQELASGKQDFIVTFDEFVSGQNFRGARRFTLQASREDPSYLAARMAFVRIYNDPSTGLLVFFPKGVERVQEKTDGRSCPSARALWPRPC
jgi:hypothetical protein